MKKFNKFLSLGLGLFAFQLILGRLTSEYNFVHFLQGFCVGLSIVFLVKGLILTRKETPA